MAANAETDERLVCAILAEQVSVLRDRMDTSTTFDLLWRTTAALAWLASMLSDIPPHSSATKTALERERAEGIAEATEIGKALNALAFIQAQKQDFARQIADCVVTALEHMAVAKTPLGTSFSSGDLAALYVSEDQRVLHNTVIRRLNT